VTFWVGIMHLPFDQVEKPAERPLTNAQRKR
jgi:hypothetical protein